MDNIFSTRERDILKIIAKRKLTLKGIATELFRRSESKPFDPEITINNSVKRINKKCKLNKMNWKLERTKVNNKLEIKKVTLSKS